MNEIEIEIIERDNNIPPEKSILTSMSKEEKAGVTIVEEVKDE